MPTQDELAGLFDRDKSYQAKQGSHNVHLTELIELTTCCSWALGWGGGSEDPVFDFSEGSIFGFPRHVITFPGRALPVRAGN
jgi:hypothetical protein